MQDGRKRAAPIEAYPKFWNLNFLPKNTREILRIPAGTKAFDFMRKELEMVLQRYVLPATTPEFPTARRLNLGMNSLMLVLAVHAREGVEGQ